jgi:hypothetical protein
MGIVTVPVTGRRVFIDGKLAGDGPLSKSVKCGAHKVQIGSHGDARPIDVPCGGEITVGQ